MRSAAMPPTVPSGSAIVAIAESFTDLNSAAIIKKRRSTARPKFLPMLQIALSRWFAAAPYVTVPSDGSNFLTFGSISFLMIFIASSSAIPRGG